MVNDIVRKKLVEIAKTKRIIFYEDLVNECNLSLNLENINDRNQLSSILGEISKNELDSKPQRPPISVLVVLKNSKEIMPSYGFFSYMDELHIRKPKETDKEMRNRLMNWCYDYW